MGYLCCCKKKNQVSPPNPPKPPKPPPNPKSSQTNSTSNHGHKMVHLTERSEEGAISQRNLEDLLSENNRFEDFEAISAQKKKNISPEELAPSNPPHGMRQIAQRGISLGNISQSNINHDFRVQGGKEPPLLNVLDKLPWVSPGVNGKILSATSFCFFFW